ncbi:hypothetical protein M0R89_07815 [Halorussus limi]|uniref:Uncharacterized protein n=1 Tax=Halorussus limi TaxID=2938695 RepID=A0A8U0HZ73_9EURY|nr:hypothetical protein [Halorussus limi]UPV75956.1 hypothetical protein M0R89_07815 [Halorussus limi]
MANTRVALAKGFSVGVVVILLLSGGAVLFEGGFGGVDFLLAYLLALLFSTAAAAGIWTGRYRLAAVGGVGMLAEVVLQRFNPFFVGLTTLLLVAVVVGYSGRTREHLSEG